LEHFGRQEFQTHGAMVPRIFRLVDDSHPSAADFFEDAIVRDSPPSWGICYFARILGFARGRVNEEAQLAGGVLINAAFPDAPGI
jgi:hypothetical protein